VQEGRTTRRARGDRTRAALVAAGVDLFGRQGVEATAVDEITAAAQVAKGTFYVHFEHKTDVLLERAAACIETLSDATLPAAAPRALEALGDRVAAEMSLMARPVMGRMVREIVGNRDAWLRILGDRPTLNAIILPVVQRGREDGTLRTDLSARRLAQALTILWLDAVVGWAERAAALELREDLRRATALFLAGAARRDA
jgi:AcrR family transcriptional regulator